MKKFLPFLAILAVIAIALILFLRPSDAVPENDRPLVIGFENDVPTFDTLALGNVFALRVGSQIFEGLTVLDSDNRISPGVAERWESSDDLTSWRFTLRKGVKFHPHPLLAGRDRTVIAEDVVYSFTRMLNKNAVTAGPLSSILKGAIAFQNGTADQVSGLSIPEPGVVQFDLTRPDALFPGRIASPAYGIVPKAVVDAAGDQFGQSVAVGTGPFSFVSRDGNELILSRFNEYWGGGSGVKTVIFRTVKDDLVRLREVQAGRLSATYATPAMLSGLVQEGDTKLEVAESFRGDLQIMEFPIFNSYFLAFNYPTVDPSLRRAVMHALQRKEIIQASYPETGLLAAGPIPLACAGYQPLIMDTFDPAAVETALAEFKSNNPGVTPTLEVLTSEVAESVPIGAVIQSQLKPFGIEVNLVQVSFNEVIDRIQKENFQSLVVFFEYQYSLPQLILENFFTTGAAPLPNVFLYRNPETDQMIADLFTTPDEADSLRQAAVVEKKIIEDAPGVFLFQTNQVIILVNENVQNVQFNAANFPVLTDAKWQTK